MGPCVVTLDEVADPDDLELGCALDGEEMQRARTSDLIFDVPDLIARLSAVCPLLPGDLIFTAHPRASGCFATRRSSCKRVSTDQLDRGIGEIRNPTIGAARRAQ